MAETILFYRCRACPFWGSTEPEHDRYEPTGNEPSSDYRECRLRAPTPDPTSESVRGRRCYPVTGPFDGCMEGAFEAKAWMREFGRKPEDYRPREIER